MMSRPRAVEQLREGGTNMHVARILASLSVGGAALVVACGSTDVDAVLEPTPPGVPGGEAVVPGLDAGGPKANADGGPKANADGGTAEGGPPETCEEQPPNDGGVPSECASATERGTRAAECLARVGGNRISCAPLAGPRGSSSLLNNNSWLGFRFEVGAPVDLRSIGLEMFVQDRYAGGSIFAAVVRLTGPADVPDRLDLTGPDVVARTVITAKPMTKCTQFLSAPTQMAPIVGTLAAGWYAAVFGTGAFGASLGAGIGPEGTVPNSPDNKCSSRPGSTVFGINRASGQAGDAPQLGHHLFVDVVPR